MCFFYRCFSSGRHCSCEGECVICKLSFDFPKSAPNMRGSIWLSLLNNGGLLVTLSPRLTNAEDDTSAPCFADIPRHSRLLRSVYYWHFLHIYTTCYKCTVSAVKNSRRCLYSELPAAGAFLKPAVRAASCPFDNFPHLITKTTGMLCEPRSFVAVGISQHNKS